MAAILEFYLYASACQILQLSDNRRWSYGVISTFQYGGHRVGSLLLGSGLVTSSV